VSNASSASTDSSSGAGSFSSSKKSSYQSPFESDGNNKSSGSRGRSHLHGSHQGLTMLNSGKMSGGASTTSTVSLDLLMDVSCSTVMHHTQHTLIIRRIS
jgi:hypothetical protein